MRTINLIVVHCSATPEGHEFSARDIDRWHRRRGFNSIGYHYVIRLDGTVERGREEACPGAHCSGYNRNSIGICYIGGLAADGSTPKDTRTPEQKQALRQLIAELRARYGPRTRVAGHNRLTCRRPRADKSFDIYQCGNDCSLCRHAAKACPSFHIEINSNL